MVLIKHLSVKKVNEGALIAEDLLVMCLSKKRVEKKEIFKETSLSNGLLRN